jgi:hypothetical protein
MAGRPQGATARTTILNVRLTPQGMAALDGLRGGVSRSAYIRGLLAAEAQRKKT